MAIFKKKGGKTWFAEYKGTAGRRIQEPQVAGARSASVADRASTASRVGGESGGEARLSGLEERPEITDLDAELDELVAHSELVANIHRGLATSHARLEGLKRQEGGAGDAVRLSLLPLIILIIGPPMLPGLRARK
jgi:hypothetical protein